MGLHLTTKSERRLEALDATEPYNVCIVGAGLAGCLLAVRFVRAGLRTLLVEAGDAPRRRAVGAPSDLASCEYRGDADRGRRAEWDGACERFDPADFETHPYAAGRPWPLLPAELEPFYGRAEDTLGVTPGRRAARPPRDRVARHRDRVLGAVVAGAAGAAPRRAVASRGTRPYDPQRELLPEFVASPTGELVTGVRVARLLADRNGRIMGATCRARGGQEKTARAGAFVLACGAVETPRLLLLSRSRRFPQGIGNDHGQVGARIGGHALVHATGRLETGWPKAAAPELVVPELHGLFHAGGLGSIRVLARREAGCGALPLPRTSLPTGLQRLVPNALQPRIALTCRVELGPSPSNRIGLSDTLADAAGDPCARVEAHYSERDRRLADKAVRLLERWLDRVGAGQRTRAGPVWDGPPFGACLMGASPARSVCDATLRVHSSPNLYVCGPEAFPTGGAVPAALTVAALAHRLADHLAARAEWCDRAAAVQLKVARRRAEDAKRRGTLHPPRRGQSS